MGAPVAVAGSEEGVAEAALFPWLPPTGLPLTVPFGGLPVVLMLHRDRMAHDAFKQFMSKVSPQENLAPRDSGMDCTSRLYCSRSTLSKQSSAIRADDSPSVQQDHRTHTKARACQHTEKKRYLPWVATAQALKPTRHTYSSSNNTPQGRQARQG
jgi:hypothetical protein